MSNLSCKDSVNAPLLASAKNEVIVFAELDRSPGSNEYSESLKIGKLRKIQASLEEKMLKNAIVARERINDFLTNTWYCPKVWANSLFFLFPLS